MNKDTDIHKEQVLCELLYYLFEEGITEDNTYKYTYL